MYFAAPGTAEPVAQRLAWLEAQLQPKYAATPAQRTALARARAEAVQQALLAGGQVPAERVLLSARASGTAGKAGDGAGARMELKVE